MTSASPAREVSLGACVCALRFTVKIIAVYLLSIVSFFVLDVVLWVGIVMGGLTPVGFMLCFITRAGLADLIANLFLGIQASRSKLGADLALAMLVFAVPPISLTEASRILFGFFIKIPRPPYVSLTQSILVMALLYEFPRLILLIAIKRFLHGTRELGEGPAEASE